jgi:hypothetical protein
MKENDSPSPPERHQSHRTLRDCQDNDWVAGSPDDSEPAAVYMYNMKSISGVRGWAGTALDALESQDIYYLFRNKKKAKKFTLIPLCSRRLLYMKIVKL